MIQIGISILKLDIFLCNYTKINVGNYTALIKVMIVFRQNTVAFLFLKMFVLHQYLLQNEQLLEEKSLPSVNELEELVVNVEEN